MDAFLNGADGVAIISCHPGECDYGEANMNTNKHVIFLKKLFKNLGLHEDRIQQYFCAAAEVLFQNMKSLNLIRTRMTISNKY
jgi:coenzyme F420-reducing hydrogenase delta subunit